MNGQAAQQPQRHHLTPEQLMRLAFLSGQGMSDRQVAADIGCDHSTVTRRMQPIRHPECRTQSTHDVANKPIMMINWLLLHYVAFIVYSNPILSCRKIAVLMKQNGFTFCAEKSKIATLMQRLRVHTRLSTKQPRLTKQNEAYRLKFALTVKESELLGIPWVFSDEVMIDLNPSRQLYHTLPGAYQDNAYQEYQAHPKKDRPSFHSKRNSCHDTIPVLP
jgi:hypothetical protein